MEHPKNQPCCAHGRRKRVTVLLLRHGERQDEAMKRAMSIEERKRHSLLPQSIRRENSMDPSLTQTGYEQAISAWKNILSSLHHRGTKAKVTVVCSPLRRCIGTALMLSGSNTGIPPNDDWTHFDWWSLYPLWNDKKAIPILVMNGLCSCASAIERFGGEVLRAIQAGYDIPWAVPPTDLSQLANGSNHRFVVGTEVHHMMDVARQICDVSLLQILGYQAYRTYHSASEMQFSYITMTEPSQRSNDGQLVSPEHGSDSSSSVKQVLCSTPNRKLRKASHPQKDIPSTKQSIFSTPPRNVCSSVLTASTNRDQGCPVGNDCCLGHRDGDQRSFLGALNRAVQMSAATATDTEDVVLIAVTHREGIRSLVDHCQLAGEMVVTPYCCIGSFTATVDAPVDVECQGAPDPTIHYTFHSVIPYSDFTVDYLRSVT